MIKHRYVNIYPHKFSAICLPDGSKGTQIETSSYELPFEIEPTEGEHNYRTCEGCQAMLTNATKWLTDIFDGTKGKEPFPLCCPEHKNLLSFIDFKREDFAKAPEMAALKIVYLNQHIRNNHHLDNWYKVITDYIEYAVESFGHMPKDCGGAFLLSQSLNWVSQVMQERKEIPEDKKHLISAFIKSYLTPSKSESTDIKTLINSYQKWLDEFPFGVHSYFGSIKEKFEKTLPILSEKPEINMFTGVAKAKLHTQESLVNVLVNLTKKLLNEINARDLIDKGIISNYDQHRFDLESENLRIATDEITKEFTKGELRYVKTLKQWLLLHKNYFRNISDIIKTKPPKQTETKSDKLKDAIGKHGFYEIEKVKTLSQDGKEKLLGLMISADLPYCIAMFDHLGFITYLEKEHFHSKFKLNKEVAKWLETNDRAIKGNINVLNPKSTESKTKYTSHLHKQTVQNDYQKLK